MTEPSDDGETVQAPRQPDADRVEELAATIDGLVGAIAGLSTTLETNNAIVENNTAHLKTKIEALAKADARRKRAIRLAFATIAFDLVLTVVVTFLLNSQADANRKIRESLRQNYTTTQQQTVTRVRVLCPLYTVLLAAASDPSRAETLSAAQRAAFDRNVQVIRDGYTTLGCQPPLPGAPPTS